MFFGQEEAVWGELVPPDTALAGAAAVPPRPMVEVVWVVEEMAARHSFLMGRLHHHALAGRYAQL